MEDRRADVGRRIETWFYRSAAAGWFPLLLPLLEGIRALGPVLGHVVVFSEPLLSGFVEQRFLAGVGEWLMDDRSVDRLLARLEEAPVEQESC